MNKSPLTIGIDFGTSGVRLALINKEEELIYTANQIYTQGLKYTNDWKKCLITLIKSIPENYKANLRALAIDGTSGTILACDRNGFPLGKALPYYLRCPEQWNRIEEVLKKDKVKLGTDSSLARALRLYDIYGTNILIRHQADWINGWLLNNWLWGEAGNNIRLGWDLKKNSWPVGYKDQVWLKSLPKIVESGSILGEINAQKSQILGIPKELKIVAGTTDSNAAVIASKPEKNNGITVLGSTIVIKKFVERPFQSIGVTNHKVNGSWLCGGASNTGGIVLKKFFSESEIEELSRQMNPNVDSGYRLRPMINKGERFPVDDENLEPILEPRPISDSLYLQALLEGLSRIELQGWKALELLGVRMPNKIITIGKGATNDQWRRIRKRIIGVPIYTCKAPPAEGAAKIALDSIKYLKSDIHLTT